MIQSFFENDVLILSFNEETIKKTIINAIKKLKNTEPSLMYNRTPLEIFDNILMGDFAKNTLLYTLRESGIKLQDYDETRTDDFKNNDPGWDLITKNNLKIEVKSSIPPNNEGYNDIINKRDIKITASHNKPHIEKYPKDIESDIHVQVYFYAKIYKISEYNNINDLYDFLNSCIEKGNFEKIKKLVNFNKYTTPLFFGWSTKNRIKYYYDERIFSPQTRTFNRTSRLYRKCPIKFAHNFSELKNYIE